MNIDKAISAFKGFYELFLKFSAVVRGWLASDAKVAAMVEEIRGMDELLAEQQRVLEERGTTLKVYQGDLQEQSAEVVRLRAALVKVKKDRDHWRDRAMEYRIRLGGQKRRVR